MELLEYKILLEKYFEGSSSLEEDQDLKTFLQKYTGDDTDLLEAKSIFKVMKEEKSETVNIDFDSIISQKSTLNLKRIYGLISAIAASLVIGLVLMFLLKNNSTPVVYAYVNGQAITNKEVAIQQSKQALATISTNLNKGTQGLNYMNKMNKPLELLIVKKQ